MAFIMFAIETMVAISGGWVDPRKDRPLLEAYPLIAGIIAVLQSAHDRLLRVQVVPSEIRTQALALSDRASSLSNQFDDACRTLFTMLSGWALASSDDKQQVALNAVRDTLIPNGLGCLQQTYLAKSGIVELSRSRMTPEMEATLQSISVEGKTMLEVFNEWVKAGQELGDAARQRSQLVEETNRVTPGDVQQAKYSWVRIVHALVTLLELESDIPKDVRHRLLQPLRDAEAKQARRKKVEESGDEPANSPDGDKPTDKPADKPGLTLISSK